MLGELCMNVGMTLRNGGSVLIPSYPSGVVYDLFECLSASLDSHGLTQVPMFFISPVADASLAYSNILAEWLSSVKQNKVGLPLQGNRCAILIEFFLFIRIGLHTRGAIPTCEFNQKCSAKALQAHLFARV